jgi:hypothetical protein
MRMRLKMGNRSRVWERGLLGGDVAMFGKKVGLPESRRMTYTVQFQETLRPSESHPTTPVYLTKSSFVIALSGLFLHHYKILSYVPVLCKRFTALVPFRSGRWSTKAGVGFRLVEIADLVGTMAIEEAVLLLLQYYHTTLKVL